jgi:hypothetical protein
MGFPPRVSSTEVLTAVREFVARVDELDAEAPVVGELTLDLDGSTEHVRLRAPVARALVEALRGYHDPRDRGTCSHCGSGRLDDDFVCRSCGIVNGLFGQTLADFAGQEGRAAELSRSPDPTLGD